MDPLTTTGVGSDGGGVGEGGPLARTETALRLDTTAERCIFIDIDMLLNVEEMRCRKR